MKKYYIQIKNNRKGPFELNQLIKMDIYPDTLLWNEEMDDWKPASEIVELKPIIKNRNEVINHIPKNMFNRFFILLAISILIVVVSLIYIYTDNSNLESSANETHLLNESNNNTQPTEKENVVDEELNRKKREEAQIEENKKYIRNNWNTYIKCTRSGYTAEGLGGISGLRVYFENKTGYFIESATAEIDIITANGYIYKTEYISITNLGGNNTYTFSVPYSPRGSSVSKPRISYIKSATLNFCYSPYGHDFVDSNDPYRCN